MVGWPQPTWYITVGKHEEGKPFTSWPEYEKEKERKALQSLSRTHHFLIEPRWELSLYHMGLWGDNPDSNYSSFQKKNVTWCVGEWL
jgi:hypothetical protein